jgi:hypothetical protein
VLAAFFCLTGNPPNLIYFNINLFNSWHQVDARSHAVRDGVAGCGRACQGWKRKRKKKKIDFFNPPCLTAQPLRGDGRL